MKKPRFGRGFFMAERLPVRLARAILLTAMREVCGSSSSRWRRKA
jgi:hypothetical protein